MVRLLARESLKQELTLFIHHDPMKIDDIPLFAMLRSRLGYLSQRQVVISQNVANSDTPGYASRDLKPFTFDAKLMAQGAVVGMQSTTNPAHMMPAKSRLGGASAFRSTRASVSETTLDGNSVSLEDEMMRMSDARMSYDAAVGFYQKSLEMLRMATRAPGK
jgi:flagellar basal-body rod protein FlgB